MPVINGIDTSQLGPMMPVNNYPEEVAGRVVHVDADFLAYMASYEAVGENKSLKDMQHNCAIMIEKFRRQAGASSVFLHLTPGTSDKGTRYDLAIQKQYQANRKERDKPRYLHMMRQWMSDTYASTMHQLCEADDGMSSSQYAAIAEGKREQSIILSKDKDLNMVPGLHMDWDTGEITDTETDYGSIYLDDSLSTKKIKGYGQAFFWAQMLTGDTADNIAGLPFIMNPHMTKPKKIGPVLTYSLLSDIKSNKEAFAYVKQLYEWTGTLVGFKHWQTGENVPWQRVFVSEAQLLWMRRDKHNANCVLQWFKEINQ